MAAPAPKKPPAPIDLGAFFIGAAVLGAGLGALLYFWPSSANPYSRPIPRL